MSEALRSPAAATEVACEVCDEVRREPVLVGRDRLHGVPGEWQLTRCVGCGLVRIDPLPGADEIASFYPGADYYAHRASRGTFRAIEVSGVKRYVLRHRYGYPPHGRTGRLHRVAAAIAARLVSKKYLLPWVGDGEILDVGCGVGSALWRLRAFGWHVHGLEIDDAAAEVGRRNGLDIRTGTLEDTRYEDASFDVVRLSHVLEHVRSPLTVLRIVRRICKPDGRLWMAMPNVASWGFERFGACWFPLELPRHLYQFSPATLRALCERAGFRVLEIRHRTWPDMVLRSMDYEREAGGPSAIGPLHRRKILHRVLAPWTRFVDRRGRGDLIECWCAPDLPGAGGA